MVDLRTTTDFTVAVRAYINTLLQGDNEMFYETQQFLQERGYRLDALKNDRAVSDRGDFKHTISMPEKLGAEILRKFPEITANKKNLYRFMKAFPQFCVPADPNKTKFIVNPGS